MVDLGEAVVDAVLSASHVEHVGHVSGSWTICVARRQTELDAIIGQDGVDLVWNSGDQATRKEEAVTRVA